MDRSLAAAGVGAGFAIGGTKSSGRVIGANDTVRSPSPGSTAEAAPTSASSPRCRASRSSTWSIPTRGRTPNGSSRSTRPDESRQVGRPCAGHREGHPPRARGQVGRRDLGRHAQPLARADHDLGLPGRQGRLRREAVQPQRPRRPDRRRGRAAVQPDRPARHAEPLRAATGPMAVAAIQSGKLGKLLVSRALCYKPRESIGVKPITTPPAGARLRHLARARPQAAVSRQPGPLQLALVLGLRQRRHRQPGRPPDGHRPLADPRRARSASATYPKTVLSLGGRFGYRDQGQTANTQIAVMDYGDTQLIFEVRGLNTGRFHGVEGRQHRPPRSGHDRRRQVLSQGQEGSRCRCRRSSRSRPGAGRATATSATSSPPCAAARSRTSTPTSSRATTPRRSATWPTSPTGSARRSRSASRPGAFGDDKEAYETLGRMEEHLKENKVALDGLNYRLGRKLTFDAAIGVVRRRLAGERTPDPALPGARSSCPITSPDALAPSGGPIALALPGSPQ